MVPVWVSKMINKMIDDDWKEKTVCLRFIHPVAFVGVSTFSMEYVYLNGHMFEFSKLVR